MRKAILVNIDEKIISQRENNQLPSPEERLTYLIELIGLSQKFQSSSKGHYPMDNTFILSRKKANYF
ncbi:MAG: hypothetical protein JNM78_14250 [Cyclobacteriaceae bacterium]|nr:hypothetical protein [Cyclobacteriaceae bacterium]